MNLLWFIVGLSLGIAGTLVVMTQRQRLKTLDYGLLLLLAALIIFTTAYIASVALEPQVGAARAAAVGALIFGGVTIIYGVLLSRKIMGTLG